MCSLDTYFDEYYLNQLLYQLSSQTTTPSKIRRYHWSRQSCPVRSCWSLPHGADKAFPRTRKSRRAAAAECEISQRTRRTVMAGIQKSKFNKRSFGVGGRTDTSGDHRDVADGARDGSEIAAISATRERVYTRACDATTRRSVEIIK